MQEAISAGEDAGEPENAVVSGDDVVDGCVVAAEDEHTHAHGLSGLIHACEPAHRQVADADVVDRPHEVEVLVELAEDAHPEPSAAHGLSASAGGRMWVLSGPEPTTVTPSVAMMMLS